MADTIPNWAVSPQAEGCAKVILQSGQTARVTKITYNNKYANVAFLYSSYKVINFD